MAASTTTRQPLRRTSKQRTAILEIVRASHAHPDAEEVFRLARRKVRSISLGTVYRNLRLLVEDGMLHEVTSTGKAVRYDGMLEDHEHFLCTRCGTIIDLPRRAAGKTIMPKSDALLGCEITDYRLDLFGLCQGCRNHK